MAGGEKRRKSALLSALKIFVSTIKSLGNRREKTVDQEVGDLNSPGGTSLLKHLAIQIERKASGQVQQGTRIAQGRPGAGAFLAKARIRFRPLAAFLRAMMSALGGEAGINRACEESPLLTRSGHPRRGIRTKPPSRTLGADETGTHKGQSALRLSCALPIAAMPMSNQRKA